MFVDGKRLIGNIATMLPENRNSMPARQLRRVECDDAVVILVQPPIARKEELCPWSGPSIIALSSHAKTS